MIRKMVITLVKDPRGDYWERMDYDLIPCKQGTATRWEHNSSGTGEFPQDVICIYNDEACNQILWRKYLQARKESPKGKPVIIYDMINPFIHPRYIGKGWHKWRELQ